MSTLYIAVQHERSQRLEAETTAGAAAAHRRKAAVGWRWRRHRQQHPPAIVQRRWNGRSGSGTRPTALVAVPFGAQCVGQFPRSYRRNLNFLLRQFEWNLHNFHISNQTASVALIWFNERPMADRSRDLFLALSARYVSHLLDSKGIIKWMKLFIAFIYEAVPHPARSQYTGYVAIDDINFTPGPCDSQRNKQSH